MPVNTPLQPIQASKFRVLFKDFGAVGADSSRITNQVINTELPSIGFFMSVIGDPPEISASRAMWRPIAIRFRDDVANAAMTPVLAQCARQSIAKGTDQEQVVKFTTIIELLGSNGLTVLRVYELSQCLIEQVNMDELAYDNYESLRFLMTVHYNDVSVFDSNSVRLW